MRKLIERYKNLTKKLLTLRLSDNALVLLFTAPSIC